MKNRWTMLIVVAILAASSTGCRRVCQRYCQNQPPTSIRGDSVVPEPGDTEPGDTVLVEPGDTVVIEPGDTVVVEPGDSTAAERRFLLRPTGVLLLPRSAPQ